MQPQLQQAQGSVIRVFNPAPNEERLKRNKNVIKTLGMTEALFGTICSLLGLAVIISINTGVGGKPTSGDWPYDSYRYPTWGEGLWGGIWVIIGGVLGTHCGKKSVTPCLVNCHMAFSIIGAVASGSMLSTSVSFAMIYYFSFMDYVYTFGFACEAAIAVLSFITLAFCITSACLCCCASPVDIGSSSCCMCCPGSYQILEENQSGYVMASQGNVPVMQPYVGQTQPQIGQGVQTQQPYQVVNRPPAHDHTVAQQSTAYETKRQDESEETEMDPSYADDVCLLKDI